MLNNGDIDLNSFHSCKDSLKERLRQMMLNQELVFMRQVYELHRLYRLQKAMMEEFKKNGLDDYGLGKEGMIKSMNLNNQAKCLIDIQLSADELINSCVSDNSEDGVLKGSSNELQAVVSDRENVSLSLRTVRKAGKVVSENIYSVEKKTCAFSSGIIDLEDPNLSFSNSDPCLGVASGLAAVTYCSRDEHKVEGSSLSGSRDVSCGSTLSRPLVDAGPSCQGQTLFDSGFHGHHREFLSDDLPSKNQTSATCKANTLDLNTLQLEDSSYFSNNHSMVVNASTTSLSAPSEKVHPGFTIASSVSSTSCKHFTETPDTHLQKHVNFDLPANSKDKDREKPSKDDDFSFSTSDDSQTANVGPVGAHSGEQDRRSSDGIKSNVQCIDRKVQEADETVQTAAELLVQLSVASKEFPTEEDNQPQCSSESYEAIVLKAKESGPDDYCVSSNAFVVDGSEKKDCGHKLKRGTRMKDFQKDILPCLSTLLRQEIREDVKIMEGVIRSREYRKMRAKMAGGGEWCRTTRSKRSRGSYNKQYYL